MGTPENPGLILRIISNLKSETNCQIRVTSIKEIYNDSIYHLGGNQTKLENQLIQDKSKLIQDQFFTFESHLRDNNLYLNANQYFDVKSSEDFTKFIDIVNDFRIQQERIKISPFNPQSSRSHLFINLQFQFDEYIGELIMIDTAGKEKTKTIIDELIPGYGASALNSNNIFITKQDLPQNHFINSVANNPQRLGILEDILKFIVNKNKLLEYSRKTVPIGFKPQPEFKDENFSSDCKREYINIFYTMINSYYKQLNAMTQYIKNLVVESFYINQSILEIQIFFMYHTLKNYDENIQFNDILNFYINKYPQIEFLYNSTDIIKSKNNNAVTLQLLNEMTQNDTKIKPTKYIMFCNIRQEPQYKEDSFETIEIAVKISDHNEAESFYSQLKSVSTVHKATGKSSSSSSIKPTGKQHSSSSTKHSTSLYSSVSTIPKPLGKQQNLSRSTKPKQK